ncbi:Transcriptional regulator [Paraburkholderia piptadeniae]|uniref:Transcriptional regulator n=1 Tax=Paraburkholderia piptadeniae TaxID=1701573 RepID=A0A1N7RW09_9BURK|nr:MarR family transcriptional regulator [Paraburkholderia piptadeniae]SIT39280.1 Transcriptional regulator [Paraburkholderia piptadeniae]
MESQHCESSIPAIEEISALALNHFFAQRAMRAFWAHFDEALRHTDVNASQFCMLALLHLREPLVFGDMATELEMDRSNLSANLAPLFRRMLISTISHEGDRRKRQLILTTEGRKAVASAMVPWMRAYQDTFAFVRLIDLDSMRDLFHVIRDMKRLDDPNVASGAHARPETRILLNND